MPAALQPVVYVVVLLAALGSVWLGEQRRVTGIPRHLATTAALLIVGVPTLAQLTVAPWLLADLERNAELVGRGQVWRLVTSLVVQDGGVAGAAFNLVGLAVVGVAAEDAWGRRRWVVIAAAAGVGVQLWGLRVQPVGGGNSVVNFGLAASLAVLSLVRGRRAPRALAVVSLAGAVVLLILGDIHGGAAAIGAVLGLFLARPWRPRVQTDGAAA